MKLEPVQIASRGERSDAQFHTRLGVLSMSDQPVAGFSRTTQTIAARVMAECRRTYGATIDDNLLESWVTSARSALLTEQTRVTQFVPLLVMRDIRERVNQYTSEAA
jgi:hypothetical protein